MNLLDSLLDAIVRLNGDALVMHVGEKPYVVTTSEAASEFRGPLVWGQVELSSRVLTSDAVNGMLLQIMPADQRAALTEYGATEFEVTGGGDRSEPFTIVAARGGDDVWLEVRRHRTPAAPQLGAAAALEGSGTAGPGTVAAPLHISAAAPVVPGPVVYDAPAVDREPEPQPSEAPAAPAFGGPARAEVLEVDSPRQPAGSRPEVGLPGGMLLDDEEWGDDVMTEGDLTELLRASAVAAITRETAAPQSVMTHAQETPGVAQGDIESGPQFQLVAPTENMRAAAETGPDEDHQTAAAAALSREALLAEQELLWAAHTDAYPAGAGAADTVSSVGAPDQGHAASAGGPDAAPAAAWQPRLEHGSVHAGRDAEIPVRHELQDIVEEEISEPAEAGSGGVMAQPPERVASDGLEMSGEETAAPARPAAVVLPLSRQIRPEAADGRGIVSTLERVLRAAADRGAATVYLVAQAAPMVRVDGEFSALDGEAPAGAEFLERLTGELLPRGQDPSAAAAEWVIDVPELGRVRCMAFRDHRGPGLIFRMVPQRAISADGLDLPAEVQALCSEADGLVLIAGGRGSGKSTLLTSFVDLINRTRSDHVITTEPQIEFVHDNKRSFISQREVRGDSDVLAAAVRAACREDPDVLVVEDLRTPELVALALEAAEAGRLVFASVPAPSAVSAIDRILEMFPADRREKTQASLAGTLRGVISQVLLRKLRGGRVAAREILLNSPAVAKLILEGKTFQLPGALETGRRQGMMPFAEALATLVREGTVHPAHAHRKAPNREQFMAVLRRDGVDASVAERLA